MATEWEGNKPGRRRKKNLWTKDLTDVKTTEWEWEGNKPGRRRKKKPLDKGYDRRKDCGMGRK